MTSFLRNKDHKLHVIFELKKTNLIQVIENETVGPNRTIYHWQFLDFNYFFCLPLLLFCFFFFETNKPKKTYIQTAELSSC